MSIPNRDFHHGLLDLGPMSGNALTDSANATFYRRKAAEAGGRARSKQGVANRREVRAEAAKIDVRRKRAGNKRLTRSAMARRLHTVLFPDIGTRTILAYLSGSPAKNTPR